jgi:hypothetical protein
MIDYSRRVVYAFECKCALECDECDSCEVLACPVCETDYADCPCPGPDNHQCEDNKHVWDEETGVCFECDAPIPADYTAPDSLW